MTQPGRTPYRDERAEFLIGNCIGELSQDGDFITHVRDSIEAETNPLLLAAYARLILALSPGVQPAPTFYSFENDDYLQKCNEWITQAPQPLRCFATGLLALGLLDRPIADAEVKENIPAMLLRRLRLIKTNALTPFEGRELLYTIDCIANMGEYQEIMEPALQENVLGSVMSLIQSGCREILFHTLKLVSHLLAHKKFGFSFVRAGGVERLIELAEYPSASYYHGPISMCLLGIASPTGVMESVLRLASPTPSRVVELGLEFLTSPEEHTRRHAVIYFSFCFPFRSVLKQFEQSNGLYKLLNILRNGSNLKTRIIYHTTLCLRQYYRAQLAVLVKPNTKHLLDIDDSATESNIANLERHREAPCHPSRTAWSPLHAFRHQQGETVLLNIVDQVYGLIEFRVGSCESSQFALEILHILTLDPQMYSSICKAVLPSGRSGIETMIDCASTATAVKGSDLILAALSVLCQCIYPYHQTPCPYHLYSITTQTPSLRFRCECPMDDTPQMEIRQLARDKNIIQACLELVRYRRSVHRADAIRLAACRILLGLSRDVQVAQVLERLQVGQVLADVIHSEAVMRDNVALHVKFRDCAMALISRVTNSTALHDLMDPPLRKVEKSAIVSRTIINYDPQDLLQVVHDHLSRQGLAETAQVLAREAKLKRSKPPGDSPPAKHTKLDHIVKQYIRQQHAKCTNPVEIVPQFSLFSQHTCQNLPIVRQYPSNNIATRLFQRQIMGGRPMYEKSTTHLIHGKYRPWRSYRFDCFSITAGAFCHDRNILMGSDAGEVRLLNPLNSSVLASWDCHPQEVDAISTHPNDRMVLTSTMSQVGLWNMTLDQQLTSIAMIDQVFDGQFNHSGTQFLARAQDKVMLYDSKTAREIQSLNLNGRGNGYDSTNAVFNPTDQLILTDGVLWDLRQSDPVFKFDKLSSSAFGMFHPTRSQVVLNTAVWDLRTCRLEKVVSSMDLCALRFNPMGNILYAFHPTGRCYRVLDGFEYRDITTIELDFPVYDVAIDPYENFLMVVESEGTPVSACRLYEIGRQRPNEADSDVEDAGEESSQEGWSDSEEDEDDDEEDEDELEFITID